MALFYYAQMSKYYERMRRLPMENKEILEIPLSNLGLDNSLPDPITYQYYKNLKERNCNDSIT